jgi:chromosomal replication initiator protein
LFQISIRFRDFTIKTRKRHVVQARQLAMFFAKKFTKASLAIGSQRDHATVLHACKTVDKLLPRQTKFVEDINKN